MSDGFFLTRERRAELPAFCVRAWARVGRWLSGRMQAQCWLAAGSRSSRTLIGTTPVPQSAAAARFLHPPLSSRTARFPRSGWKRRHFFMEPARRTRSLSDGAHALRCPCGLLHASSGWMVAVSPDTVFRLVLPLQTVFTRGSFALEALPSLIATTRPCADPDASSPFRAPHL